MKNNRPATRRYPTACTSAYCGHCSKDKECLSCPRRPALDEFNAWVEANKAVCPDPIWSPLHFVATK